MLKADNPSQKQQLLAKKRAIEQQMQEPPSVFPE